MSASMLQDSMQPASSGSSGPRFRPYASPTHHVTKGRYITSNDVRGYIPVYEYPLNGQWIMMDIDDGYILWTGIWKALGNSKADIVKMIDSQPDLAPLIRRVRGGYLKIQGTWMPYEVALKLSRRVAWAIRDDLIPLFGPTFPSTCLAPDQPGYGQVVPNGQGRRRARRTTQPTIMQMPRAGAGWTVVTPNPGHAVPPTAVPSMRDAPPIYPAQVRSQHADYKMDSPYASHIYPRDEGLSSERHLYSPTTGSSIVADMHSPTLSHHQQHYGASNGSNHHPPSSFRKPTAGGSSKMGLSLDIRSLSMREGSSKPSPQEDIRLAPILGSGGSGDSPYALPPISAMESLRDGGSSDSAAVLRRLRMDDNDYPKPPTAACSAPAAKSSDEACSWTRRHSLSTSKPIDTSPRFQPYNSPRSYQESTAYRPRSSSSSGHGHHRPTSRADAPSSKGWSEASHEGDSTSNPSPTSPATPGSLSESEERAAYAYGTATAQRKPAFHGTGIAGRLNQQSWGAAHVLSSSHMDRDPGRISEEESFGLRRNSYEVHSDSDSTHPHRPW
ncbi:hypothetical protein BDN70DRAFT_880845 [Pholiota conissans]|uniref:HTH APSES-type domain-containing protein n=1 Tax=Pholiota conissans TaxID=109636 RepID=A0A9P5YZV9_9AGAR|nr:hypothetical protein BDN70DRAFT_880845 [Pholiota conissans]